MLFKSAGLHLHSPFNAACLLFIVAILTSVESHADWNSGATIEDASSRINVDIKDDGVHLLFDLAADAVEQLTLTEEKQVSTDQAKLLKHFALQSMAIDTTAPLSAQLTSSTVTNQQEKTNGASLSVFFPFLKTRPDRLRLSPNFKLIAQAGEKYIITVSHQGLPVIDHGVLSAAETLQLDWQDPWYSQFLNPTLQRDHRDPVMAFLYIEPQQLKSEVVVRIKEIAQWAKLPLRDSTMIYLDEYETIKEKVAAFLLSKNKVYIDQTLSKVKLDKVDYIRMGAADIQAYVPHQAQKQVATLIGVSISHPVSAIPERIRWQWKLFNDRIQRVAIRAYDPAGLFDSYVTPQYPDFEWENMLADLDLPELNNSVQAVAVKQSASQAMAEHYLLPAVISIVLLFLLLHIIIPAHCRKYGHGSALLLIAITVIGLFNIGFLPVQATGLNKQQAKTVLKQLLWNVYQAFEASEEQSTYDQLAYSVSGKLIENLYLQHRQAFLIQDGAWSKTSEIAIQSIDNISTDTLGNPVLDCSWLVTGDVIHWGHQHRRENLYRANITVSAIDNQWKIIDLESIGQHRID